jgi:response regulator RpfG family c-di-GMP phosphodiesterase
MTTPTAEQSRSASPTSTPAWVSTPGETVDGSLRLLLVDDEPRVLEGLSRHLSFDFDLATAPGASEALARMEAEPAFDVVVSDLKMPGMDGIAFLEQVRARWPETTRIMLTGHGDLEAATEAINRAGIFRFLIKPCPADVVGEAVRAAGELRRLRAAERVLLAQTLQGSLRVLGEILSLANPEAFGHTTRVKDHVDGLLAALNVPDDDRWPVQAAASLAYLPIVTLPPEVAQRWLAGAELDEAEAEMVGRLPETAARLLRQIPRLEQVRGILRGLAWPPPVSGDAAIDLGRRLVAAAMELERLVARGLPEADALGVLRGAAHEDTRPVVEALSRVRGHDQDVGRVVEAHIVDLRVGMVLQAEVVSKDGVVLSGAGQELTEALIFRLRNFHRRMGIREPFFVRVRG